MVWVGIALALPVILVICMIIDTKIRAKKAFKIAAESLRSSCDKEIQNIFNDTDERFKVKIVEYYSNLENDFKENKIIYDKIMQEYNLLKDEIIKQQYITIKMKDEKARSGYFVKEDDSILLCERFNNEKLINSVEEKFNFGKRLIDNLNISMEKVDKAMICNVLDKLKIDTDNFKNWCFPQAFGDKLFVKVALDDVLYYEIKNEQKTYTKTDTKSSSYTYKKPSKIGTAFNEALFGTAYATVKALRDTQIKETPAVTKHTYIRKIATIYLKEGTGVCPLETEDVDKLIMLLPKKRMV